MKLDGAGKARLEIGPESWVFSFDAGYPRPHTWVMALQIPLQGELVFAFPGLDQPRATIPPSPQDFRWQVVRALREASAERKLNYPQAGEDFIQGLHHLLRWINETPAPDKLCQSIKQHQWDCRLDGVLSQWSWNPNSGELSIRSSLKENWMMLVTFKVPGEKSFQRVTLELLRQGEERSFTELRQEIFFTH